MKGDRAARRLALGAQAVMSLTEASELLPFRDTDVVAWLRRRGLVHSFELGEVVIWGEVVQAIAAQSEPKKAKTAAPSSSFLPRVSL